MKRLEKQIIVTFIILCLSCMNVFGNDVFNSSCIINKKDNGNFSAFTSLSVEKEEKTSLSGDKSFFKKRKDILYTYPSDQPILYVIT